MRILKLAIISFIIFFGIFTAFSLLIPSHIRLSRAINLPAGSDTAVLSLVSDTGRWKEWHPAFTSKSYYTNLILKSLRQNDSEVVIQMQQVNRRAVINGWQIHRYPSADSLTLQWYMDFHLPWYPWQKLSTLFYENTYGAMMQQGLANIKQRVVRDTL